MSEVTKFEIAQDCPADASEVVFTKAGGFGVGRFLWCPRTNDYAEIIEDSISEKVKIKRGALGTTAQDWVKGDLVWMYDER